MFSILQNLQNVSDVKFFPTSVIRFIGSPNSANVILVACTRSSANRLATLFMTGNLL